MSSCYLYLRLKIFFSAPKGSHQKFTMLFQPELFRIAQTPSPSAILNEITSSHVQRRTLVRAIITRCMIYWTTIMS